MHQRVPTTVGYLIGDQPIPCQTIVELGVVCDGFDGLAALLPVPNAGGRVVRRGCQHIRIERREGDAAHGRRATVQLE